MRTVTDLVASGGRPEAGREEPPKIVTRRSSPGRGGRRVVVVVSLVSRGRGRLIFVDPIQNRSNNGVSSDFGDGTLDGSMWRDSGGNDEHNGPRHARHDVAVRHQANRRRI